MCVRGVLLSSVVLVWDVMASFPRVVLPTPSQRAAWDKLRYEHAAACINGNLELAADRAGEASHQASAFWGHDSLLAVEYHAHVVRHFTAMALDGPPNSETDGCRRRAMVELLRDVLPQLSQRLTAGTLEWGKCTQEEEAYHAEYLRTVYDLLNEDDFAHNSKMFGASRVVDAMLATLHLLALPPWQEGQIKPCKNFVFACLTFMGSCGLRFVDDNEPTSREEERRVFTEISGLGADIGSLNTVYDKAFFEEVQQKWAALCERWKRGAAAKETPRDASSKQCALPSCDKAARTDGGFKRCSGCKSVLYCPERSIDGLEKSRVEKWKKWGKNPRVGLLVLTEVPTGSMSTKKWISRAPARRSRPTPQPPHTLLYAVDGAGVRQRKRARCLRDVASHFSLAAPFGNSSHRFAEQHKRCRMRHV